MRYVIASLALAGLLAGCSTRQTTLSANPSQPGNQSYAQTWETATPAPVVVNAQIAGSDQTAAQVTVDEPATGFALDATQANLKAMDRAQLALKQTSQPQVKKLAQRLLKDHEQANAELKVLMARKGLTLPATTPDEDHHDLADRAGVDFDRHYVQLMLEDHEKDIALFKHEADTGLDSTLREWATKKLPVLREHWRMAREVETSMR